MSSEHEALIDRNRQLRAALVAEMERTAQAFGIETTVTPAQPQAPTSNQNRVKEVRS